MSWRHGRGFWRAVLGTTLHNAWIAESYPWTASLVRHQRAMGAHTI